MKLFRCIFKIFKLNNKNKKKKFLNKKMLKNNKNPS